ncbi:hypothetical protein D0869_03586 [Hortaea werneckii]|uniref:Uncharacterized protein n=1 Tax=Hortaea werneckii TaxID=91943 RepID=A0A3M6X4M7_HORWE|nr:hypothetical protein D0869_03586 [Hortaea werneckii]
MPICSTPAHLSHEAAMVTKHITRASNPLAATAHASTLFLPPKAFPALEALREGNNTLFGGGQNDVGNLSFHLRQSRKRACPQSSFFSNHFDVKRHKEGWAAEERRRLEIEAKEQHWMEGKNSYGRSLASLMSLLHLSLRSTTARPSATITSTAYLRNRLSSETTKPIYAPWPSKQETEYECKGRIERTLSIDAFYHCHERTLGSVSAGNVVRSSHSTIPKIFTIQFLTMRTCSIGNGKLENLSISRTRGCVDG